MRRIIWGGLVCASLVGVLAAIYVRMESSSEDGRASRNASFDAQLLTEPLRQFGQPEELGPWSVVDAFPETSSLWGAMQLRAHPTIDDCWYVATFPGAIFELRRTGDGLSVRTVLDIRSPQVRWLHSFALHPRFGHSQGDGVQNGEQNKVYVFYRAENTEWSPMSYRVSAFPLRPDAPAEAADETLLIEQELENIDHVGGALEFDDQGFLFISVGDNGKWDDGEANSQKVDHRLLSGILRIDVDRRGGEVSRLNERRHRGVRKQAYFVPLDNPFWDVKGAHPEFWSVGFRSPFRISYDLPTRQLWVGEVGQDRIEQIELPLRGSNHLWSFREGSEPFEKSYLKGQAPTPLIGEPKQPFYEYPHVDQDYCIVGGLVYRGDRHPELQGRYLFGDNQSGRVWSIDPADGSDKRLLLRLPSGKQNASLTGIFADRAGRIFLTHFASTEDGVAVHELVRNEPVVPPSLLSETGIFDNLETLDLAPGFLEYRVNSPLWSDGMEKRRWLRLPDGQRIDNRQDGPYGWKFPEGTMFVKHFDNPADVTDQGPRRIETRVLTMAANGRVYGATYRWNQQQTDADLQLEREFIRLDKIPETAAIDGAHLDYRLPGHRDCVVCHHPTYPVLGINPLQLNRPFEGSGADNQLLTWSRLGLLQKPLTSADVSQAARLVSMEERDAPVELRARSYLHSNCSFCHYPEGTQRTHFDARFEVPLEDAQIVDARAATGYFEIDGHKPRQVVAGGDLERSAMYLRLATLDGETSMPYLGRRTQHKLAVDTFREWILSFAEK